MGFLDRDYVDFNWLGGGETRADELSPEKLSGAVVAKDGDNFQDKLDEAGAGGTVLAMPGTYTGTYTLPDNITLVGCGEETVFKCPDNTQANVIEGSGLTDFTLRNFVVEGNDANNTAGGDQSLQNAIRITSSERGTIENIRGRNAIYSGLRLETASTAENAGVSVANCFFTGNDTTTASRGVYMSADAEYNTLVGIHTDHNSIGVDMDGANNTLAASVSKYNSDAGLVIGSFGSNTGKSTVEGLKANHNGANGVRLDGVSNVTLDGVSAIANGEDGVLFSGADYCHLLNSDVRGNSGNSSGTYSNIHLDGATFCRIADTDARATSGQADYGIAQSGATNKNRFENVDASGVTGPVQYTNDLSITDGRGRNAGSPATTGVWNTEASYASNHGVVVEDVTNYNFYMAGEDGVWNQIG